MNFEALSINIQPEHEQWWFTLMSFENESGSRSFLHIEHSRDTWKFQLLWLNRYCWII